MDARCPVCNSVFQTDRTGIQFCPNCGSQVNVAEAPPSGAPGPGPGPRFMDPSYQSPPRTPAPPPSDRRTPWERRGELGLGAALWATWKDSAFDPGGFWPRVDPKGSAWDAISYAWIIAALTSLVSLPLQLAGRASPFGGGAMNPADAPEQLRAMVEMLNKLQASAGVTVGLAVGTLALFPLLVLIGAALLHLFCLLFGAGKNGYTATLRALCYAQGPQIFTIIPCVGIFGALYVMVLEILGIRAVHESTTGRAAGAVLTPFFVACCCLCGLAAIAAMTAFGGAGR